MKEEIFKIESNAPIAKNTYEMVLSGDTSAISEPGQFVNIRLDGFFLRRPISVCSFREGQLTLVYRTVGHGTEYMSSLRAGTSLDLLTGLGNGYDAALSGTDPLLIGGGAGTAPLYALAEKLVRLGVTPQVIMGFGTGDEVFYMEKFENLGARVTVATADGSVGIRGLVTDAMDMPCTYTYACGPVPMLRAVSAISKTGGQYSLEERMGCGFGACMGCTCGTVNGPKRVCRDGPVFYREEIIW